MVLMKEQSISLTSVKKFPQYYDFFGLLLQNDSHISKFFRKLFYNLSLSPCGNCVRLIVKIIACCSSFLTANYSEVLR